MPQTQKPGGAEHPIPPTAKQSSSTVQVAMFPVGGPTLTHPKAASLRDASAISTNCIPTTQPNIALRAICLPPQQVPLPCRHCLHASAAHSARYPSECQAKALLPPGAALV